MGSLARDGGEVSLVEDSDPENGIVWLDGCVGAGKCRVCVSLRDGVGMVFGEGWWLWEV